MRGSQRQLPLAPLLRAYTAPGLAPVEELVRVAGLGPRIQAVLAAPTAFLSDALLDRLSSTDFSNALVRFYQACVRPALHSATLARRAGMVRHALAHLLRCPDPLPAKLERCLAVAGPYHVAGLGPAFWSAVCQGLDPHRHPAWTPATVAGLRRLGLARRQPRQGPGPFYAALSEAHDRLRSLEPALTALHIDHFLSLVAVMQGRDLWTGAGQLESSGVDLAAVIRQERIRLPLRRRLKEQGQALHEARRQLEAGLSTGNGALIGSALSVADPASCRRTAIDWHRHAAALLHWVDRLWQSQHAPEVLEEFWRCDPIPGAGLWLPAAVLHLREPQRWHPWGETERHGFAVLDDNSTLGEAAVTRYLLFNEGVAALREQHRLHPLEAPAVLAALVAEGAAPPPIADVAGDRKTGPERRPAERPRFGGFCADTFHFLEELGRNNQRDWMTRQRDRYRFAVREPLIELCETLAERYVDPVLRRQHGWDLETAARSGRALTSVCKNDYGRSVPYHTVLWITFYRRGKGGRGEDMQFFVRLDAAGLSYGLRLGRQAEKAALLFRRNVQEHAELLFRALSNSGALAECRFSTADDTAAIAAPASADGLRTWSDGKSLLIAKTLSADARLLTSDELAGEILLTFDRLLPAYACAVEADPVPTLARRAGIPAGAGRYTDADFCKATFLDTDWLGRARALLDLKRQLILQGVPGTGKTHVARCLARLLTGGHEEAIRLVQFHPAYSYEEFVEGIKVRSVEVNGRQDVTYPVEDGLLCAFAGEAARRPAESHVLIIDEINRGNLPRVFGELLYLLEYRDQAVGLPYSKRGFRLPANLYLLGTMNAADRSVALVDQAMRRRFSFLEMPPDARVLAAWLRAHPPAAGQCFAEQVVTLFERLNARLRADLGPQYQVGHSYFLVPNLDEARLRVVWQHHIQPLLEEYFAGHANRTAAYDLDALLTGEPRRSDGRKRRVAGVSG